MEQWVMSDRPTPCERRVSRRDFLNVAAVGGGAIVALGMSSSASAATKKFSQKQAHYQPVPKSGQRCQNCSLWQAPTSCQVVEGQVSPAGWCILYQAKS
jgi:anaerobic selenocysteine-containing dehydrogenase